MSQAHLAARLVTILEKLVAAIDSNRGKGFYCQDDHRPIADLYSQAQGLAATLGLDRLRPLEESGLLLHERSSVLTKIGPNEVPQPWPQYTPVPGWFEGARHRQKWDKAARHTLTSARAISDALNQIPTPGEGQHTGRASDQGEAGRSRPGEWSNPVSDAERLRNFRAESTRVANRADDLKGGDWPNSPRSVREALTAITLDVLPTLPASHRPIAEALKEIHRITESRLANGSSPPGAAQEVLDAAQRIRETVRLIETEEPLKALSLAFDALDADHTSDQGEMGHVEGDADRDPNRAGQSDPLSPLQNDILDALRALRATDRERRANGPVIAGKVGGGATEQSVKAPLAELTRRQLTNSATGRGGGSWLTSQGLDHINSLRPKQ
jgi:hypothetical protein